MKKFKNMADLSRAIDKLGDEFKEEVVGIVGFNLTEMEAMAKRLAPGAGDRIQTEHSTVSLNTLDRKQKGWTPIDQAINKEIASDGLSGSVYVEKSAGEISAYTEFGTGQSASAYLATVPNEWKVAARKFYISGKGTILNRPYLYPSFFKYSIEFQKELKKALNNLNF